MKIIFVYNADSGYANSILDIGHKLFNPNTYQCNLCDLTFGILKERNEWKKFRVSIKHELEFLHRNEFEHNYKEKRKYPTILKLNELDKIETLMSKEDLNKIKEIGELIDFLSRKIK